MEGISLAQTSVLAAGLYKPREAALLGLTYIIGRYLKIDLDSCTRMVQKQRKGTRAWSE